MTGIVIPSGREESFPGFSLSVGGRKLMTHFVVKYFSLWPTILCYSNFHTA